MSTPFLGEIKMISWNFAPRGWAFCNGQSMLINQNQALFSLFGTTYGGNGQTTFFLPNMQGRVPVHVGQGINQGQLGGEVSHTLSIGEMPAHNHLVQASSSNSGNVAIPTGNYLANATPAQVYSSAAPNTTLIPDTIGNAGGSQPHPNMQPYLVINYCVALQGIFPSRN